MNLGRLLLVGCLCACGQSVKAEQISAAVASNFTAAMRGIVSEFEKISGHHVLLSFASSGGFYAQINHGAPFDVFFSADQIKPAALERAGLAVAGSRFTYAIGTLALWSATPGLIDAEASVLQRGDFRKLALANPRLAPYGAAAVQVLENLQLKQSTEAKWVLGENIVQTWQFVSTGNADIGFVALAQIIGTGNEERGSHWLVPQKLYTPIRQDAVLLRRAEKSRAARELLQFVRGEQAAAISAGFGYRSPAQLFPSEQADNQPADSQNQ